MRRIRVAGVEGEDGGLRIVGRGRTGHRDEECEQVEKGADRLEELAVGFHRDFLPLAQLLLRPYSPPMSAAITLPLHELTRETKLRLMEELWDDLCHSPEGVPSPDWHAEVLADRRARVQRGEGVFLEWEEVKAWLVQPRQ